MMVPGWLKYLRFRIFYYFVTKERAGLVTLGDACPWTIDPTDLREDSYVLCAGVGHDISFEKALIASYGCKVVLLDPSPTGQKTMRKENLAAEYVKFLPIGLAGKDGLVDFQEPIDRDEGSFVAGGNAYFAAHHFRCQTPSTLISQLGWDHVDLLKIDIEGLEYEVIQHVLQKELKVRQICVEFHHGDRFRQKRKDTIDAILALRRAGYDLIHRNAWDHTFIRRTD